MILSVIIILSLVTCSALERMSEKGKRAAVDRLVDALAALAELSSSDDDEGRGSAQLDRVAGDLAHVFADIVLAEKRKKKTKQGQEEPKAEKSAVFEHLAKKRPKSSREIEKRSSGKREKKETTIKLPAAGGEQEEGYDPAAYGLVKPADNTASDGDSKPGKDDKARKAKQGKASGAAASSSSGKKRVPSKGGKHKKKKRQASSDTEDTSESSGSEATSDG